MGCAKSLAENNFGGTLDGETMSVIGKWEFPAVCFCMIFSVIKKIFLMTCQLLFWNFLKEKKNCYSNFRYPCEVPCRIIEMCEYMCVAWESQGKPCSVGGHLAVTLKKLFLIQKIY